MSSEIASPRIQKRGKQTKRRLIEVTKGLLADFEYQSITLDQIASEVGVAKSSILWHFGSKDALLTEAVFQLFEQVDERITLEKANLTTLEERLEYLLKSVAEYFVANPEAKGVAITLVFNTQVPVEIHERIQEQWEQHIQEIRTFLSSDDVHVSETSARAIMALMHGCYLQWYLRGKTDDLRKELPEAFAALHHDIGRLISEGQK